MKIDDSKKIAERLVDTFIETGKISMDLRAKGLKKEIKDDNTPVTNADIEINNILIKMRISTKYSKVGTMVDMVK